MPAAVEACQQGKPLAGPDHTRHSLIALTPVRFC